MSTPRPSYQALSAPHTDENRAQQPQALAATARYHDDDEGARKVRSHPPACWRSDAKHWRMLDHGQQTEAVSQPERQHRTSTSSSLSKSTVKATGTVTASGTHTNGQWRKRTGAGSGTASGRDSSGAIGRDRKETSGFDLAAFLSSKEAERALLDAITQALPVEWRAGVDVWSSFMHVTLCRITLEGEALREYRELVGAFRRVEQGTTLNMLEDANQDVQQHLTPDSQLGVIMNAARSIRLPTLRLCATTFSSYESRDRDGKVSRYGVVDFEHTSAETGQQFQAAINQAIESLRSLPGVAKAKPTTHKLHTTWGKYDAFHACVSALRPDFGRPQPLDSKVIADFTEYRCSNAGTDPASWSSTILDDATMQATLQAVPRKQLRSDPDWTLALQLHGNRLTVARVAAIDVQHDGATGSDEASEALARLAIDGGDGA